MNWLKAKRLIRRKPYLLDPYRCRSAEDAQKILDEEGVLSPDALLSAARVRAGMSGRHIPEYHPRRCGVKSSG